MSLSSIGEWFHQGFGQEMEGDLKENQHEKGPETLLGASDMKEH